MKLDHAIGQVWEAEVDLGNRLLTVADRHIPEPDVNHLGHSLSRNCRAHLELLRPFAEHYDVPEATKEIDESSPPRPLLWLRHKSEQMLGDTDLGALMLLDDLGDNYLAAARAEIGWIILGQAARALRQSDLVEVVSICHEETMACAKWLRTKIKEASPQILTSS